MQSGFIYFVEFFLKPFKYLQSVISERGDYVNDFMCTDDFITKSVELYSDMMYRVAYNITKNSEDAFDVCQDVFVRLVCNKDKIKNNEQLKAWLLRATVNCSKSHCTQAFKKHCVTVDELYSYSFTDDKEKTELFDAVMHLPEKYRTVIHLFYYEDLTIEQIANALGITKSAVKSRLHRGRENLKQTLEKEN